MTYLFLNIFAYLCGSIPFGKIVGTFHGIDIQKKGSGNIGFANVVRVLGWKAGLLVLVGDVAKGALPVLVAQQYIGGYQLLTVALLAILGHIFPIWLRFKGGKGIATGLGVTLALNPNIALCGLLVYGIAFLYYKKSAPSSIVASWSLPFLCLAFRAQYLLFFALLACIATWTHRSNINMVVSKA